MKLKVLIAYFRFSKPLWETIDMTAVQWEAVNWQSSFCGGQLTG